MFVISQYLLNASGTCKNVNQVSTYSIVTGLVLYASIYLYLLFYNEEYLNIFNKFIIYIIIIDLLLSTFYYFSIQKESKRNADACVDTTKYTLQPISQYEKANESESDDEESYELDSELDSDSELEEEENIEEDEDVDVDELEQDDVCDVDVDEIDQMLEDDPTPLATPFVINNLQTEEQVIPQIKETKPKRSRAPKKKVEHLEL
jgi:hypothetical protein